MIHRTSDESWDREVLEKRGLVDGLAALVSLRQPRQILVRQAYHVELHVIAATKRQKDQTKRARKEKK